MCPPPFSKQTLDRILDNIEEKKIIELAKDLIKIKSFTTQESKISSFIANYLRSKGIEGREINVKEVGNSIISRIVFSKEGPVILVGGHMDTGPVYKGWTKRPFLPRIEKDRLYGLGSYDMKTGIAVMLETVTSLTRAPVSLKGTLILIITSDGNGWSRGINTIIDKRLLRDVKAAFYLSPTPTNHIINGRVGRSLIKCRITNSNKNKIDPRKNSISVSSKVISSSSKIDMGTHKRYQTTGRLSPIEIFSRSEILGQPEKCNIIFDSLYLPGDSIQRILIELKRSARLIHDGFNIDFTLLPRITSGPKPYIFQEDSEIVREIIDSYKFVKGQLPKLTLGSYTTDENYIASLDIPIVSFGVSGNNRHKPNESVDIKSIKPTADILAVSILKYLK
ncbi:MAG: M20 family metallopeptidase [Candidatus Ranarchaeia archaeon]